MRKLIFVLALVLFGCEGIHEIKSITCTRKVILEGQNSKHYQIDCEIRSFEGRSTDMILTRAYMYVDSLTYYNINPGNLLTVKPG